ncbi:hypothetical protein CN395_15295 [Priestia megaterium]|nr:hypothetical protein CN395_15295 [Priestia megaterium]
MFSLIFTMGFRSPYVGVDDFNYMRIYDNVNHLSTAQYYQQNVTEPGYYILNKLVYLVFDDFQWLIIIVTFFTVFCFYKALAYEIENISLAMAVFIFATTQYFYYFGIVRLGIAVAIISVAYRYIIRNQKKKFLLLVLLATLFHYSALFSLILLFARPNYLKGIKKDRILKLAIIVPISFIFIKFFIYPFVVTDRYSNYMESSDVISLGFITSMPFFILSLIFFSRLDNKFRNYNFYVLLYSIKLFTEIFSPLVGIGRMVWYVNLSLSFLLPGIIKNSTDRLSKFLVFVLTILFCVVYAYTSYFGDSSRGDFMLPYKTFFFDNLK